MSTFTMVEFVNYENAPRYLSDDEGRPIMTLGNKSYIVKALIESPGKASVLIGNYCSIAHSVTFVIGMNHKYDIITTYPKALIGCIGEEENGNNECAYERHYDEYQISIGHDVWIGRGATILSGVRIGNGAVIGAQAVVAKDVPPYAIVVGNPGQVIKYRFDEATIQKLQEIKWWYWEEKKIIENKILLEKPNDFIRKFYVEKDAISIKSKNSSYLKKLRKEGIKLYYFIPDFGWQQSVWQNVIKQYLFRYKENEKVALILGIPKETECETELRTIYDWIEDRGKEAPALIKNDNDGMLSLDILQNVDTFISTRSYESIQCIDYIAMNGSILSGLNDIVFE